MNEASKMLRAVLEDPRDFLARLAYADALEEEDSTSEARWRFIRAQVAIGKMDDEGQAWWGGKLLNECENEEFEFLVPKWTKTVFRGWSYEVKGAGIRVYCGPSDKRYDVVLDWENGCLMRVDAGLELIKKNLKEMFSEEPIVMVWVEDMLPVQGRWWDGGMGGTIGVDSWSNVLPKDEWDRMMELFGTRDFGCASEAMQALGDVIVSLGREKAGLAPLKPGRPHVAAQR